MRRRLLIALAGAAFLAPVATTAGAAASRSGGVPGVTDPVLRPGDHAAWLPGEVIVKFRSAPPLDAPGKTGLPDVDAILRRHATTSLERLARRVAPPRKPGDVDIGRIYRLRYADGTDALLVARELAARSDVEYAEPRFVYPLDLTPNDPSYATQTPYLDRMQFPAAWNTATGGGVVIAICDGGTDWDHADLLANVWSNPGEVPGNHLDDDHNGYVDDVRGWNFSNDTNDPTGLPVTPSSANHGTHVAGIACGVANNGLGIAGASYNAKFMPICTASPTSDNSIAFGYDGILYAAENGADIVNCSWGGAGSPSAFEQDVVDFAYQHGTVVVAAAGNTGGEVDHYPSAYDHVFAVSNVTNADAANAGSTYGVWVDVAAQGTGILSTLASPANGYGSLTGTSMSSPHAAAACALVKARFPGYLPEQVMQRVRVTSDNIDALLPAPRKGKMGYGRVNASRALLVQTPAISVTSKSFTTSDGDAIIEPGETVTVSLQVTNWLAACTGIDFKLRENSAYTTMVDSTATLAGLDSLQTQSLAPLRFTVSPSAQVQTTVLFTLAIATAAPAYTDKSRFELTILQVFATHDANRIACSVTSVGKLGYALTAGGNGKDGIGFRFDGAPSELFEGGLMIGTSASTVSDGCRTTGTLQDDDFRTATDGVPRITEPAAPWSEAGVATFTDALAAAPLGLEVRQRSLEMAVAPNDDFIILEYRIRNDSGVARHGLRVGWFCDWDIDAAHFDTNQSDYDAARGLIYAFDTSAGGPDDYVGITTLTPPGTTAARGIWNDPALGPDWGIYDEYSDAEKWETLSTPGATHPIAGPADISLGMATGPFEMAPGDSIKVAFAFVGGKSLAELRTNTDAARALWNGITSDAGEPGHATTPRRLGLRQNVPNPFNPSTTIAYELPRAAGVVLRVYGVDGRLVRTLACGEQPAGPHRVRWDGRDESGRALASGTYFYRFTTDGKTLVRKMQLVK